MLMWGQPPHAGLAGHPERSEGPWFRYRRRALLRGTFSAFTPYLKPEDAAMRAYLTNLTPKTFMLLAAPIVAIAYPVVTIVVPAVVRAVVPEVVRSVLSLL
jgi:hypothetical protein